MRTTSAGLILSLLTLGTACSGSSEAPAIDDHGLAAARMRWATHRPSSYSFTQSWLCGCPPEMTRPMRIGVTSDQITSVVYADDQLPVAEPFRGALSTIDGVFDRIQDAIDQDADEITVTFDPTQGYPTSVFVDYSRQAGDDELTLRISDLTSNAS